MSDPQYDLVIVGAGPAGLAAAAHAQAEGLRYLLLERTDHLADTVFRYQKGKPVMAEPGLVPLRSELPFTPGRREEVLAAWEATARDSGLAVRLGEEVTALERDGVGFSVVTAEETFAARRVVLAIGTQGNPRKLGAPGEELPHVHDRLADAALYDDLELAVVGAGDSALEVALALAERNRVHLVVRKPEIVRAKEALEREVLACAKSGSVVLHFSTTVREILPDSLVLATPEGELRVAAAHVFLQIGTLPPLGFLSRLGVETTGSGRDARPVLGPDYQSSVPGLYLIGAVSGRDLIKLGINQGYEVVEHALGRPVEPADEAILAERLPFWEGPVADRIAQLQAEIPLLAGADPTDLREVFLSAGVHQVDGGAEVVRQNDYTDSFLVVVRGRVRVTARPEGAAEERPVATLGPGEFFGEMSLLSGRRRNATVTAEGPARLLEIPRKAMLKLLAVAPEVERKVDEVFLVRAFQSYLFPELPTPVLADLAAEAELVDLAKGETVFREGELGDAFYLIRSGMVKISKLSGDRDIVLTYLTAGNFFGETALLSGGLRSATVTAIFPSELIRLPRADFERFLGLHPELRPRFEAAREERAAATLLSEATPGAGRVLSELIREEVVMGTDVLLIDDHKCIRCGNCLRACEGVHDDGQARLSLTGIQLYNLLAPNSCWQCEDPLCMLDCPPDAIVRDAHGEVYIKSSCIGCGNCADNCPYGNIFMVHPRQRSGPFAWLTSLLGGRLPEAEREVAVKCDLCRSLEGGPACVRSCPTGAALRLGPEEYQQVVEEMVVRRGGA